MSIIRLDFDGDLPRKLYPALNAVVQVLGLRVLGMCYAKTRRGWHVMIPLSRKVQPAQLVCLQAILGSDPMRELYNVLRVRNLRRVPREWREERRWNVLYSRHDRRIAV